MSSQEKSPRAPRCPVCKKAAERSGNDFFPFCSERCKLVDLGRWIGEDYRIPVREEKPSREDGGEPDDEPPLH